MKRILYLSILLLVQFSVSGQPWLRRDIPSANREAMKPNLKDLSARFEEYWKTREVSINESENADEGGYEQFKRWEWFMKPRTWPDGYFFPTDVLYDEYVKIKKSPALARSASRGPAWTYLGPDVVPINNNGVGRLNVIRFHPNNSNIIYVGAACGGVWKTTDGGTTWSNMDDFLPSLSIADIAINPRYPDSVYIATGDGYGYESGPYDFWGGLYTAGILVSPDGGQTWNQTGWSKTQADRDIIQRLQINPADPNILLITTRNGIFRSLNAGVSWTQIRAGHFYDIEFRPGSADTIFTTNGSALFRSINRGQSFSMISNGLGGGRVSLAVTEANPDIIYSLNEGGLFRRSTNGGVTFTTSLTRPTSIITLFGYYDCVLGASPVDPSIVFVGGVNTVRSTDGGDNWVQVTNTNSLTNVHVDCHSLEFIPGTNNLFIGTDGGIWKTLNYGLRWFNLSSGLGIKQYYRITQSSQDPYLIYAGSQDNGTDQFKNGVVRHVTGGDGMDNAVNTADDDHVITSYQYGQFLASSDGGLSFDFVAPANGAWVTPIVVDPNTPSTFYAAYQDVYKSTDNGYTWTPLNTFNNTTDLIALAVSGQSIYTANEQQIWVSHNGGNTWNDISNGLPSSLAINFISVSPTDPNDVWICFSGYTVAQKVYHSTNGGLRWENFSTGIPNIPVNCIMVNPYAADGVFAGTDLGVYYSEAGSDWYLYGRGLPNVIVSDLEIIHGVQKIRAGTYGRGIWEADLPVTGSVTEDAALVLVEFPAGEICSSTFSPIVTIKNFGTNTLTSLNINYGIDGDTSLVYAWSGSLAQGATTTVTLPSITTTDGPHDFAAYVSDPNGVADMNGINDLRSLAFNISSVGATLPVIEGFEANNLNSLNRMSLVNTGNMLSVGFGGAYNMSSFSLKASFYNTNVSSAMLTTQHLDLTNALSPVGLRFDYAHARYSANYSDSMYVLISTDCGATWTELMARGGDSLATAPPQTTPFYPLGSQWNTQVIDLTPYSGNSNVMIRFEFRSGFGNNLYLDNINILDNFNSVEQVAFDGQMTVFPNPFSSSFRLVFNSGKEYTVNVTDMTGRVVYTRSTAGTGFNSLVIPAEQLSSGVYFVTLRENGAGVKTVKIVKE